MFSNRPLYSLCAPSKVFLCLHAFIHSSGISLVFFHFRLQALVQFPLVMFDFFLPGKHHPGFIQHGKWLEVRWGRLHKKMFITVSTSVPASPQTATDRVEAVGVLMAGFHHVSSPSPICLSWPAQIFCLAKLSLFPQFLCEETSNNCLTCQSNTWQECTLKIVHLGR